MGSQWYDPWILKEKLCTVVPYVAIQDTSARIKDVWFDGKWNFNFLYTNLPDNVVNAITATQPRVVQNLPDVWTWSNSNSGMYSVKDAYNWLLNPALLNDHVNWKWIWQLNLLANIQFFVWQLIHESIPVRAVLQHRRVCNTDICPRCAGTSENIDHCLFSCPDAARVWNLTGLVFNRNSSQGADTFTWYKNMGKIHGSLFFIALWVIWCGRNEIVFNNHRENTHTSMGKIYSLLKSCEAAFMPPHSVAVTPVNPCLVSWSPPMEGTVCLNVDGSLFGATSSAGYGGLIRDHNGVFISGFYGAANVRSILFVELMAVLHGLHICWESGFRRVTCYSDSLQLVNLIRDGVSAHHRFANEVFSIRQLLARDWEVAINHTLREVMRVRMP
ncbi:uncharacterized protein LOC123915340 [Trifolium pratense]|uniref:uncharacterized protein LOC123915340 n=1 Tax=Trifolium pratense TaxID=57577 RepID=UPI001E697011|nr:uncharacterized protein LOC123915340 [Trifolium pratense]